MDTIEEQRAFSDKHSLPFPLLADTTGAICDAFGVLHPKNKPKRETFLFRKGRLVYQDRAVNPGRQAKDVLEKISELSNPAPASTGSETP